MKKTSIPTGNILIIAITAVLFVYATLTASAQLPHPFDVTTLDGTNGFMVSGVDLPKSISCAGDTDNDGIQDILIGDFRSGYSNEGLTYLIYGSSSPLGISGVLGLADIHNPIGRRFGVSGGLPSQVGIGVSGVGDINRDGYSDYIIGADTAYIDGKFEVGMAALIFGDNNYIADGIDFAGLDGMDGVRFLGVNAFDYSGKSVSGVGDVNGDGISDFLIAADCGDKTGALDTGVLYLIYGKDSQYGSGGTFDLSAFDGDDGVIIYGAEANEQAGNSVSGAGDFNGDGISDFIIGASYGIFPSADTGKCYLVFGSNSGIGTSGILDLADLDGTNGVCFNGSYMCGFSVSGPGDVNGDGFSDILIGAHKSDPIGIGQCGEASLVYGTSSVLGTGGVYNLADLNGTNGARFAGNTLIDGVGFCVSGAGDTNADGYMDMLIGAIYSDYTFLIFGTSSQYGTGGIFALDSIDGTSGIQFTGDNLLGYSVSGAGDFNTDGIDDLMIGSETNVHIVFSNTSVSGGGYSSFTGSGDAGKKAIGIVENGSQSIPSSRCWIDYDGGSGPGNGGSSLETVTITRSKSGISGLYDPGLLADVVWEINTDRTGWTAAEVTFMYIDGEIAGLNESELGLFHAPSLSGPWTEVPSAHNEGTNQISGIVGSFSYFAIADMTTAVEKWDE